ncbi:ArsA family ATPase [Marinisporobacter balticus]|uniref:Arsenite efflux ATP-binding protein ArsA n=1 Tax=Marinisporobacter balticus TaxID=2018667 RepID=A0A4R2LDE9_9FIRM|nr:ArsA family ATPase [Marinisporobacter balticus]TCO77375.1 arsenite efflux ATP-binding protein ArsA [Marinisporobacter balticus]
MTNNCLTLRKNLTFIIFSGKGGVGKTTCACATALHCAKRGQKTLLASTDPAHSLADSLDLPVGRAIGPVDGVDNLYAIEVDAPRSLEQFKQDYGNILKEIANRGTYFDRDDINDFFSLSLPGLDELMGIMTLMDLLESREYDVIVLDTAPTGHTIRLLSLPDHMREWLRVLDLMLEKRRYMASVFAGRYVPDYTDDFIKHMASKVSALKNLLTDHTRTQFIPVIIPEAMSLNETEKLVKTIKNQGIPLTQMIVNRVASDRKCAFCQGRRADQINTLREIDYKFKMLSRVHLPLLPHEVRGISVLTVFAERMVNPDYRGMLDAAATVQTSTVMPIQARLPGKELIEKKYVIIGGKGGVGKTSVAAATGLYLASQGKKTLIFSTDPAHSLSDSFGCSIGNQITSLSGSIQLYGLEIDAQRMLDEFKQQYVEEINEVFNGFLGESGVDVAFDREVMTEIISLIPPGLDEVMALIKLMELSDEKDYDVIILDTAPTGHLIRMLELPELAMKWLHTFFKLVLKYQNGDSLQKTADLMFEMIRGVRKVQSTLVDPDHTGFIGVTVPEAMIVEETEKLLESIQRLGVNSRCLVVNMVTPPNQCYFCNKVQAQQQSYMADLRARFTNYQMSEIPLFPHQVRGIDNLTELARLFG